METAQPSTSIVRVLVMLFIIRFVGLLVCWLICFSGEREGNRLPCNGARNRFSAMAVKAIPIRMLQMMSEVRWFILVSNSFVVVKRLLQRRRIAALQIPTIRAATAFC
jgi:hypothetical protein